MTWCPMKATCKQRREWTLACSDLFRVVPWGFRKLLNWIKDEYNKRMGMLDDPDCINYMGSLLDAILENGCNVTTYYFWTLMHNFAWQDGYLVKFGLYKVDFDNRNLPRTTKRSAFAYQDIIVTRKLTNDIPTQFLH